MHAYLEWPARQNPTRAATVEVIEALAGAAIELARIIAAGSLAAIGGECGGVNPDGDRQKTLDIVADRLMRDALRTAPVAAVVSEEVELPETLDADAPLCVAIDPLDGSANLENNISVGTIFSIRPKTRDAISTFFEPGTAQCAAGCFIYGPQTVLVLALDQCVDCFTLDPRSGEFVLTGRDLQVPPDTAEFAINASNRRHWSGAVRGYIDQCLAGVNGERGQDYNMRWIGSLVAETYRILIRGGVFLYPADARQGYREGRLRLLYEAHPIALIMEWAGGAASDGRSRILELSARTPHQRVPLIMGSTRAVRDVDAVHLTVEPLFESSDAPLFARRGLFR
ncbi:class 1 fructose-bisphosphatase [Bradyrhizobium sp. WSM 1704]|uniref:class 1 fructose-bisphosphatase n=1 Tax=Bradyrhizobium semiaridum TaxID=2821404 RepID=UPI001CE339FF|nr:class 1 fructose-bisphosphatase [Bradyrhizobium semiaridum]MCA6121473.1 class 1 fructose-bisphosphatase [Bradyrhizobium semiaridum]